MVTVRSVKREASSGTKRVGKLAAAMTSQDEMTGAGSQGKER